MVMNKMEHWVTVMFSFDNDASDDQDSDTNANKCAPKECLAVKDVTNVKNTGKDIQ